ncbi:hypothetical protein Hte_010936 [Hypoxylon texense]
MVSTRSASKKAPEARGRPKTKPASASVNTYPQRSSLRRALQVSRRDAAAASADASTTTAAALALPPPPPPPPPARPPARHRRTPAAAHANGVPAPRRGWYQVRAIVAEAGGGGGGGDGRRMYLVDWEGRDPRSGCPWPYSWVDAKDVTRSAKREWEDRKEEGEDAMQGKRASASASTSTTA